MKPVSNILITVTLTILLSACASTSGPSDIKPKEEKQPKRITPVAMVDHQNKKPHDSVRSEPSLESIKHHLPETITPLTTKQLESKVPHSYYFDYNFEPQPGRRIWRRIDNKTWHEIYPDGLTSVFKVLGHTRISDTEGTLLVKWSGDAAKTETPNDGGLQAFIPDLGSSIMHHWYRNTERGDTTWNDLAPMKEVK